MKKYECYVIKDDEVARVCGKPVIFSKGFMRCDAGDPDWLNMLQKHIGKPIVSIREVNREAWREILVLCADGYLADDDTPVLCGTMNYLKTTLADIFFEAENDEYEVFDCFQYEIEDGTYEELYDYIHEEW